MTKDRRFVVHHPAAPANSLYFLRDTKTGELVRGKGNRLRSFKWERDAQKACDALEAEGK